MTPNVIRQNAIDQLTKDCGVFYAFGRVQFEKGMANCNLKEGDKLVDVGYGCFMPKSNLDKYIKGNEEITKAFKEAMKDEKARKEHILYELNNHEAFYTRDIESTLEALGEDFTRGEVMHVFDNRIKNN